MPTTMNKNVQSLFTICTMEMWKFYPKKMKNGPKSLKCVFCIKALLTIKERYEHIDSSLKSCLNYHFTVTKEKDRYNEFEVLTFTTCDNNMIKTFMTLHVLYQMNIMKRIILPDYYYRVAFVIINVNGIKTKKYNTNCNDMFIFTLHKQLRWLEGYNNWNVCKFQIIVLRSLKPRADMLNYWGLRSQEKPTHGILFVICQFHCFVLSIVVLTFIYFWIPLLYPINNE